MECKAVAINLEGGEQGGGEQGGGEQGRGEREASL